MEDEDAVRVIMARGLSTAGYRVIEANNGTAALKLIDEVRPALVVLDVNMPDMGGYAALEAMRRRNYMAPVLMVSAQGELDRRLKGLDLGADDFLPKPFDLRELLARVAALLRRVVDPKTAVKCLTRGSLTIDLAAKKAEQAGQPLALTATEFAMLEVLARCPGEPVSKETLLDAVWGYTFLPNTRTVETHIWRLRKKLGESAGLIQNRAGFGYLLALSDE